MKLNTFSYISNHMKFQIIWIIEQCLGWWLQVRVHVTFLHFFTYLLIECSITTTIDMLHILLVFAAYPYLLVVELSDDSESGPPAASSTQMSAPAVVSPRANKISDAWSLPYQKTSTRHQSLCRSITMQLAGDGRPISTVECTLFRGMLANFDRR